MSVNHQDKPSSSNKDRFKLLCDAKATLWQLQFYTLQEAADHLQDIAAEWGLIDAIGQDEVQGIIATAFAGVTDAM